MKVGISGYDKSLDGNIDFFEIDILSDELKLPQTSNVVVSISQFFYRVPNPIPLDERIELIGAKINSSKTLGFSIKLTPGFFEKFNLNGEVALLRDKLIKTFSLPVWIDLPKVAPANLKLDLPYSTDPLWKAPKMGGYWKIHGWHDVRWVRRYSDLDLQRLVQQTTRYKPSFLVFGHSQRAAQINEFLAMQKVLE